MANIYKSVPKATVCKGNTCVTVYGNAEQAIEEISVTTVTLFAVALLAKALKLFLQPCPCGGAVFLIKFY